MAPDNGIFTEDDPQSEEDSPISQTTFDADDYNELVSLFGADDSATILSDKPPQEYTYEEMQELFNGPTSDTTTLPEVAGPEGLDRVTNDFAIAAESFVKSYFEYLSPSASLSPETHEALDYGKDAPGLDATIAAGIGEGLGSAATIGTFTATGAGIGATAGLLGGPLAPVTSSLGAAAGGATGAVVGSIYTIFQGARRESNSARIAGADLGLTEEETEQLADRAFWIGILTEGIGTIPLGGILAKAAGKSVNKAVVKAGVKSATEVTPEIATRITGEVIDDLSKTSIKFGKYYDTALKGLKATGKVSIAAGAEGAEEVVQDVANQANLTSMLTDQGYLESIGQGVTFQDLVHSFAGGVAGGAAGGVAAQSIGNILNDNLVKDNTLDLLENEVREASDPSFTRNEQERQAAEQAAAVLEAVEAINDPESSINEVVIDNPNIPKETIYAIIENEPGLYVRTDDTGQLSIARLERLEAIDFTQRSLEKERSEILQEQESIEAEFEQARQRGKILQDPGELVRLETLQKQLDVVNESIDLNDHRKAIRDNRRKLAKLSDQKGLDPYNAQIELEMEELQDDIKARQELLAERFGTEPTPQEPTPSPKQPKNSAEIQRIQIERLIPKEQLQLPIEKLTDRGARSQLQLLNSVAVNRQLFDPELQARRKELAAYLQNKQDTQDFRQSEAELKKSQEALDATLSTTDPIELYQQDPDAARNELQALTKASEEFDLSDSQSKRLSDLLAAEELVGEENAKQEAADAEAAAKEAQQRRERQIADEDERTFFTRKAYRALTPELKNIVGEGESLAKLKRRRERSTSTKNRALLGQAIAALEQKPLLRRPKYPQGQKDIEATRAEITERTEKLAELARQRAYNEREGNQAEVAEIDADIAKLNEEVAELKKLLPRKKKKETPTRKKNPKKLLQQAIKNRIHDSMDTASNRASQYYHSTYIVKSDILRDTEFLLDTPEGRTLLSELADSFEPLNEKSLPNLDSITLTEEEQKTVEKTVERDLDHSDLILSPRAVKWAINNIGHVVDKHLRYTTNKRNLVEHPGLYGTYNALLRRIEMTKYFSHGAHAHEVGHAIWAVLVGRGERTVGKFHSDPELAKELLENGKALYKDQSDPVVLLNEGFAEFFRLYVTTVDGKEKLKKALPRTYAWFHNQLLPSIKGLDKAVNTATSLGRQYSALNPVDLAQSKIRDYNYIPARQKFAEKLSKLFGFAKEFSKRHRDVEIALHWLDTDIERILGHSIPASKKLGQIADASRGHDAALLQSWVKKVPTDKFGHRLDGKLNLLDAVSPVSEYSNGRRLLGQYLLASRTLMEAELYERRLADHQAAAKAHAATQLANKVNKREYEKALVKWAKNGKKGPRPTPPKEIKSTPPGARPLFKETGMTVDGAREILARTDLEAPKVAIAAKNVEQWFQGILHVAGSFSPSVAKYIHAIEEQNGTAYIYVPLSRADLGKVDATKKRTGSDRELNDPLIPLTQVAQSFLQMGKHGWLTDTLVEHAKNPLLNPLIHFASQDEHLKAVKEYGLDKWTDWITDNAELYGIEFNSEKEREEVTDTFIQQILSKVGVIQSSVKADHALVPVRVIDEVSGKTTVKLISVNKDVAENLLGIAGTNLGGLAVAADKISNLTVLPNTKVRDFGTYFKLGTTGLFPGFFLGSNPSRDIRLFLTNTENDSVWPIKMLRWVDGAWKAFWHAVSNGHAFKNNDVLHFIFSSSVDLSSFMASESANERHLRQAMRGKATLKDILLAPGDYIASVAQSMELAPRIAEIELMAKKLGVDWSEPLSADQFVQLVTGGKNITVDFSRAGTHARIYNRIYPFWNPQLQGNETMLRKIRQNPARYMKRQLLFAAANLALWSAYKDEDWYKAIPNPYKYLFNWFAVKTPEGLTEVYRIPALHMEDFLFSTLPRIIMDGINQQDPKAAGLAASMLFENLWPVNFYDLVTSEDGVKQTTLDLTPIFFRPMAEVAFNYSAFNKRPLVSEFERLNTPSDQIYRSYNTETSKFLATLAPFKSSKTTPVDIDHYLSGTFGRLAPATLKSLERLFGYSEEVEGDGFFASIIHAFKLRSGEFSSTLKPVVDLHATFDSLLMMQATETPEQREVRLQTKEALGAIYKIAKVIPYLKDQKQIDETRRMLVNMANEANSYATASEVDRKMFKEYRKLAEEIYDELVPEENAR